jgi:hypothetical protein
MCGVFRVGADAMWVTVYFSFCPDAIAELKEITYYATYLQVPSGRFIVLALTCKGYKRASPAGPGARGELALVILQADGVSLGTLDSRQKYC